MASPFLPSGATTGDSGGELSSGDDSGDVESLQSPETEASRSLTELFEKAAARLQGLVQVASREQLLYLYARYKQVKVGNCNTPKPSFFDFEGKQKWEAWKALGDSSPSQAMQEYIAVVKKLDPSWNPQSPEKKGRETNTGFGGPVVSSLYHEEIIREEDKNIFDYCRENNIDHITRVFKSKNVDVNMKDEEGRALLHWACDRGHKELVTVLLQHRADINCQIVLAILGPLNFHLNFIINFAMFGGQEESLDIPWPVVDNALLPHPGGVDRGGAETLDFHLLPSGCRQCFPSPTRVVSVEAKW
ncbi:acyl-CoA-binding domain-containing protein 6 isoform X2 [Hippopotamus amphibius kiboko]|uniref:acyl-CoA-binding domain-containing protein 6 isoform X2 n=1 Tax=Hippopotamus amphibius kiboko TaxID=575201 RepID=UPI002596F0E8|nr:acyl-CoA-binding domain-containing protein 6 isoform X2 [Hippopotamus amphibius kiboko]